jgi:PIN domain nuclease of toxin-antitoxin system
MLDDLPAMGLVVEPFTPEDGDMAGRIWAQTRQYHLSLGYRACLSLGLRLSIAVFTSDRIWANLTLPLDVQVIR